MKALMTSLVIAATAVLSGCGAASATPSATAVSANPSATTSPAPSASDTALPTTAATPAGCVLHTSLGSPNSYTGHTVITVELSNAGSAACTVNGYPTVVLLDGAATVASPTEVDGGGQAATATPTPITLNPGQNGQFIIEFTDVQSSATACPTVTSLQIELPSSAGGGTQPLGSSIQPCPPTFNVGAITAAP